MTYTSCKKCASRRDCWIRSFGEIELRTRDPSSPTYELVLKASRGECPLFSIEEADLDG